MFDKHYRPLPHVIKVKCDYDHLPFRFRQKIKKIQGYILDMRHLSKNSGLCMYLFDDACLVLDPIRNKVLCTYRYTDSIAVVMCLLRDLYRLFSYEKNCDNLKNTIQVNDYYSLKKKFYGC